MRVTKASPLLLEPPPPPPPAASLTRCRRSRAPAGAAPRWRSAPAAEGRGVTGPRWRGGGAPRSASRSSSSSSRAGGGAHGAGRRRGGRAARARRSPGVLQAAPRPGPGPPAAEPGGCAVLLGRKLRRPEESAARGRGRRHQHVAPSWPDGPRPHVGGAGHQAGCGLCCSPGDLGHPGRSSSRQELCCTSHVLSL